MMFLRITNRKRRFNDSAARVTAAAGAAAEHVPLPSPYRAALAVAVAAAPGWLSVQAAPHAALLGNQRPGDHAW